MRVKPSKVCLVCGAPNNRPGGSAYCLGKCSLLAWRAGGRVQAYAAVARAVKRGDLPRPSTLACVDCGGPARDYDHRDYGKPLDVQPVCRPCNKRRGPAIKVGDPLRGTAQQAA